MFLPICEHCGGVVTEFCGPISHHPYYPCWASPEARAGVDDLEKDNVLLESALGFCDKALRMIDEAEIYVQLASYQEE